MTYTSIILLLLFIVGVTGGFCFCLGYHRGFCRGSSKAFHLTFVEVSEIMKSAEISEESIRRFINKIRGNLINKVQ